MDLKNNKGQSTVEYVLVLAVVLVLFLQVFFSDRFRNFLNGTNVVFTEYREYIQSSYRQGVLVRSSPEDNYGNYTEAAHPTYAQPDAPGADSRFYLISSPYGQ